MMKEYMELVDLETFGLSFEEKYMWNWKDARGGLEPGTSSMFNQLA